MDDCDKAFKEWVEKEDIASDSPKGHYMLKGAYLGFRACWDHRNKHSEETYDSNDWKTWKRTASDLKVENVLLSTQNTGDK